MGGKAEGTEIFQSTLPVGGGTAWDVQRQYPDLFQSTLPVGGGTLHLHDLRLHLHISIHPPRGGRDRWGTRCGLTPTNFNPPSPWGEGRHDRRDVTDQTEISIHPPRGGRDVLT